MFSECLFIINCHASSVMDPAPGLDHKRSSVVDVANQNIMVVRATEDRYIKHKILRVSSMLNQHVLIVLY